MQIVVVYVFPLGVAGKYHDMAVRFLDTYHQHPPGMTHDTVIVCNGAPLTDEIRWMFDALPGIIYLEHDNSGFDVGAYQRAAREIPCDLMVFFGGSTYLRGPNWLQRMVGAYQAHGDAQYGTMGNVGQRHANVSPHIRTTAFWMPPHLMNSYPTVITKPEQRYGFEHGRNCFTSWVSTQGLKSWVVNWSREYEWPNWNDSPNGFHRGNQSDLIAGDRLTMPPYYPTP